MALQHILSALREIILDIDTLPENILQREDLYQKRFSHLSKEEVEDLAKMPPEKLGIYTTSIFAGERGSLQNHYSLCLAYMKSVWLELYQEELDTWNLPKNMHKVLPWKGFRTITLLQNFRTYILEQFPELPQKLPFLQEVLDLEFESYLLAKSPNTGRTAKESLMRADLITLSVDELLGKRFCRAELSSSKQFEWNIPQAYRYFHTHDETLPESVEHAVTYAFAGRTRKSFIRWVEVPETVYNYLCGVDTHLGEGSPSINAQSLTQLAEVFLPTIPENKASSEEEQFLAFLEFFFQLIDAGVVICL